MIGPVDRMGLAVHAARPWPPATPAAPPPPAAAVPSSKPDDSPSESRSAAGILMTARASTLRYLNVVGRVAAYLGVSRASVGRDLAQGDSLVHVAQSHGVSRRELVAVIEAELRASASPDEQGSDFSLMAERIADRVLPPDTPPGPVRQAPGAEAAHPYPSIADHDVPTGAEADRYL